jgi:hypothetical protein
LNVNLITGYLLNNTTPIICGGYVEAEGITQSKCYALVSGRVSKYLFKHYFLRTEVMKQRKITSALTDEYELVTYFNGVDESLSIHSFHFSHQDISFYKVTCVYG